MKYVSFGKTKKRESNRIKLERWEAKSKKAQTCNAESTHTGFKCETCIIE